MIIDILSHTILSATHTDTLADTVVRGDILYGNSTPKWARLPKPSVLSDLSHDGTDVSWVTATGTGAPVRAAGATLTTPTLGVATATTINGNALTPGTWTLTGGAGKTLTFNQSIALTGTDAQTYTFPTTSATLARTDADSSFTAGQSLTKTINATSADGWVLTNTTAAAAGAQQWSPRLRLTGQGWKTTSTAASQTVDFIAEVQPVQGSTNPTANFVISSQVNAAGYSAGLILTSAGRLLMGNGSNALPAYSFASQTDMGFINDGSGTLYAITGGSPRAQFSSAGVGIDGSNFTIGVFTNPISLISAAAATLQYGADVNGAAINQTIQAANGITGTDKTGGSWDFNSGKGTGAGAVSSIRFGTPAVLTTGATAQSIVTRLTITEGSLTLADATNFVFNATTGTKHGTATSQKQSFWNATPIAQPTTAIAASTFAANTSGIANDTATWDSYTIGQVVKALRNVGLLA